MLCTLLGILSNLPLAGFHSKYVNKTYSLYQYNFKKMHLLTKILNGSFNIAFSDSWETQQPQYRVRNILKDINPAL